MPSESGQVFRIDPATGAGQGTPFAIRGTQLESAAVSRSGSVVAALGWDGRLQLWDGGRRDSSGPLFPPCRLRVRTRANGAERCVTGGIEEPGMVEWNLAPSSWVAAACRRVQRD